MILYVAYWNMWQFELNDTTWQREMIYTPQYWAWGWEEKTKSSVILPGVHSVKFSWERQWCCMAHTYRQRRFWTPKYHSTHSAQSFVGVERALEYSLIPIHSQEESTGYLYDHACRRCPALSLARIPLKSVPAKLAILWAASKCAQRYCESTRAVPWMFPPW